MIRFLDGPANGTVLELRRAPLFLRVVIEGETVDALDLVTDTPKPIESIHVYHRQGKAGAYHLLVRGPNARRKGGWWASGDYALYETQPEDAILRKTASWQEWCQKELEKLIAKPSKREE